MKTKVRLCLGSVLTLAGTMILCTIYLGTAIYLPNMRAGTILREIYVGSLIPGVTFGIVGLVVIGAGLLILYNEYCDSK